VSRNAARKAQTEGGLTSLIKLYGLRKEIAKPDPAKAAAKKN